MLIRWRRLAAKEQTFKRRLTLTSSFVAILCPLRTLVKSGSDRIRRLPVSLQRPEQLAIRRHHLVEATI